MKFLNEIWCLIPARSGSKGIKNKNIKKINNKPLIHYSIETAFSIKDFKKVIFSSDSKKYINLAIKKNKKLIIHKRNKKTSSSYASEYSVFYDFINNYNKPLPKYFAHFRPTNPIRDKKLLKKAIHKFKLVKKNYSCLRTIKEMPNPAFRSCMVKNNKLRSILKEDYDMDKYWKPRQLFPKTYFPTCTIDIYKTDVILKSKTLWGKKIYGFIEKGEVVDIDSIEDFNYVSYLLNKK